MIYHLIRNLSTRHNFYIHFRMIIRNTGAYKYDEYVIALYKHYASEIICYNTTILDDFSTSCFVYNRTRNIIKIIVIFKFLHIIREVPIHDETFHFIFRERCYRLLFFSFGERGIFVVRRTSSNSLYFSPDPLFVIVRAFIFPRFYTKVRRRFLVHLNERG